MADERTKVLFIAGSGRSGSTLLDNILGQVEGYFSCGELRYLWERGVLENRLCGCGRHLLECPLWSSVLEEAFGGVDHDFASAMVRHQRHSGRARHVPRMLAHRRRPQEYAAGLGDYPERLARLYRAIAASTGSTVVIDSSKLPAYGWILEGIASIDLRVVHLVRDPRAAAYSWMRKKVQPDRGRPGYMDPQHPLKSSFLWALWNSSAELFWSGSPDRYLRLRYEDLVQRPQDSVRRVLDLLGNPGLCLPFVDETTVQLEPNHTVAGNPNRLQGGTVQLRPDAEWVTAMPMWARALVTTLTAPLLLRYGYQLWRPGAGYTSS